MNKAFKRHGKKPYAATPYWLISVLSMIDGMTNEMRKQTEQILAELENKK